MSIIKKFTVFIAIGSLTSGCIERRTEKIPGSLFARNSQTEAIGTKNDCDNKNKASSSPVVEAPVPEHHENLFAAVKRGDILEVEGIIENHSQEDLLNLKTQKGQKSLLIMATQFNQWAMVKWLLDQGVDPQQQDSEGRDAAWYANAQGQPALADLISGELSQEDINRTFLEAVSENKKTNIIFALDVLDAEINAQDRQGRSALIIAIGGGQVEIVSLLLERGISTQLTVRGGRKIAAYKYAKMTRANQQIIELLMNHQNT